MCDAPPGPEANRVHAVPPDRADSQSLRRLSVFRKNRKARAAGGQLLVEGGCFPFILAKNGASSSVAIRFILGSEWGDGTGCNESELVCRAEDGELIEFFQDCSLRAGKPTV
jgi:hypothetical protein